MRRSLFVLGWLACAGAQASTLQLTPEQRQALAPTKAVVSPADLSATLRDPAWRSQITGAGGVAALRAFAGGRARAPALVSGLLLDAAQNATEGRLYGVRVAGGAIDAVLLAASAQAAPALAQQARTLGARVRGMLDRSVYVSVPVGRVPGLRTLQGLAAAWPDFVYESQGEPAQEVADAAGVAATHVAPLHAQGITGRGVKIGIIDLGFARYEELVAQKLVPRQVAQVSFGEPATPQTEGSHGTACAEIVHAMAPDAQLWLARFDGSEMSGLLALRWMAQQHVDIISASWGRPVGPKRGNTPLDQAVDRLVREGTVWVAASGNEGARHWLGRSDQEPGGLIRVPGSPEDSNLLALDIQSKGPWKVSVTWDDWPEETPAGSERQDIDLFLMARNPRTGKLEQIGSSSERQVGSIPPMETLVDKEGQIAEGTRLYLALSARHVTRPFNIHVNVSGPVHLTPSVSAGSLSVPATARGALAVAAYDLRDGRIAPYSSRGPTDDGRTKPEVSAPSHIPTIAYQDEAAEGFFEGTSAAAPHVSGFAALLAQARPDLRGAALRDAVIRAVQPLGAPIPNTISGFGLIDGARAELKAKAKALLEPELPTPPDPLDVQLDQQLQALLHPGSGP